MLGSEHYAVESGGFQTCIIARGKRGKLAKRGLPYWCPDSGTHVAPGARGDHSGVSDPPMAGAGRGRSPASATTPPGRPRGKLIKGRGYQDIRAYGVAIALCGGRHTGLDWKAGSRSLHIRLAGIAGDLCRHLHREKPV